MAHYLVQSGTLRMTVGADDPRKAALWATHLAMEQVMPLDDDPTPRNRIAPTNRIAPPAGRLGRRIRVLRTDGVEAELFDTYDVLIEWNQLMVAMDRIESEATCAVHVG